MALLFLILVLTTITLVELVELINKVAGTDIKPKFVENPVREGYVRTQLADINKISKELGFEPKVELEEGLKEIIDKLKSK